MIELPEELRILKRFHGHLGPYVVVGYKMGRIGRQKVNGKISAVVHTGTKRPLSCIIDGIQFSSSCTLGKGNILVVDDRKARATFTGSGMAIDIVLRDEVKNLIESTMSPDTEEEIAVDLFYKDDNELFIVREIEPTRSE
jgi:formylmethanofuran dehydrogenase subunit E